MGSSVGDLRVTTGAICTILCVVSLQGAWATAACTNRLPLRRPRRQRCILRARGVLHADGLSGSAPLRNTRLNSLFSQPSTPLLLVGCVAGQVVATVCQLELASAAGGRHQPRGTKDGEYALQRVRARVRALFFFSFFFLLLFLPILLWSPYNRPWLALFETRSVSLTRLVRGPGPPRPCGCQTSGSTQRAVVLGAMVADAACLGSHHEIDTVRQPWQPWQLWQPWQP